jgi:hypothetical protein
MLILYIDTHTPVPYTKRNRRSTAPVDVNGGGLEHGTGVLNFSSGISSLSGKSVIGANDLTE